jgi:hypothetical protein
MTKRQRRAYVNDATKGLRDDNRDCELNMIMAYCSIALAGITLLAITGA